MTSSCTGKRHAQNVVGLSAPVHQAGYQNVGVRRYPEHLPTALGVFAADLFDEARHIFFPDAIVARPLPHLVRESLQPANAAA